MDIQLIYIMIQESVKLEFLSAMYVAIHELTFLSRGNVCMERLVTTFVHKADCTYLHNSRLNKDSS